ncbi:MAG: hypothetical protein JG775_1557 [Defluviitaleaceae bacterium]|nr:hypothetical protein [Defluviitaleaceae bacterium]
MSNLKIRIAYNGFEMELDGDDESVKEIYNDTKEELIRSISRNIIKRPFTSASIEEDIKDVEILNIDLSNKMIEEEIPSIFDIAKKGLPKGEADWVLVYCYYASNYGQKPFNRNDIVNLYEETNRSTPSRKANLSNNLQTLFHNDLISQLNEQDMIITDKGNEEAKAIIYGRNISDKKSKKNLNNGRQKGSSKRETYSIIDLNLSEEETTQLKDEYARVSPKGQKDQVLLLCYLLKNIKGVSEFDTHIIHTALRLVNQKTPKLLSQTLRDIKNKQQFIYKNENGKYSLNHVGENYVKFDLIQGGRNESK